MNHRRKFIGDLLKLTTLGISMPVLSSLPKHYTSALKSLDPPDLNGISLLDGFSSRIVAKQGVKPIPTSNYYWHQKPDGGAVYNDTDLLNPGGWIYVSNEESSTGGVGVLRFNSSGNIIDSYRILDGTNRNCAGGKTPWGTWLSAEEIAYGQVWECDPSGVNSAVLVPSCGSFHHEAVAVDPVNGILYLTEDRYDGHFYRSVLPNYPSLQNGVLQSAEIVGDLSSGKATLNWRNVPNPNPVSPQQETRYQVPESSTFKGGEGIWYFNNKVYFATKFDNRIWSLDLETQNIKVIYDIKTSQNPILSGVDNVTVDNNGYIYVCEDGGDMQIVMLNENGLILPILQIHGQDGSEITGVAFTQDNTRMYFSSQRGPSSGGNLGITYEVQGPFDQLDVIFKNSFN
jgi:hypothetical protein